ncbi:ABC transporter substrate-binding protein [Streptomyces sp. NPDC021354]|uniref:ABC transporter substrate-binding protein n=1 Tax=Streptomyces sp. NPDC021354 TaxID=3154793 RepID=UPI00340CE28F
MRPRRLPLPPSPRAAIALVICAALGATAGCASLASPATETGPVRMADPRPVRDGGTLTVALKSDPDKLDPTLASTAVGRTVFSAMCEKLYDVDQDNKIVPQLAAALPKTTDHGRTVTIRLREGIRFADGTPLDARAVKTSLERHKTLTGSTRAGELKPVTGVSAIGDDTLRLRLSEPYVPLLSLLADRSGMVMSPKALKTYGDRFASHPTCVGPFRYEERVVGDRIVLRKDPRYYDADKVHLDRVVYRTITDGNVRMANLLSGDIQVGDQMDPVQVGRALTEPGLQLFHSPSLGYYGLTLNIGNTKGAGAPPGRIDTPIARDVRVREAFDLSLDRALINKIVFQGMYRPTCGPLPEGTPYSAAADCPAADPAKARRLLRQAGVSTPVQVRLQVSTTPEDSRLGQVVQAMAKEAGFEVTLRPTEFATGLQHARSGDFQAATTNWSGRLDPAGNIDAFAGTGGAQNYGGLSDPTVDKLIADGHSTADMADRKNIYERLVERVRSRHTVLYLIQPNNYVSATKDIAGLRVLGDGLIRVKEAGYTKGDR